MLSAGILLFVLLVVSEGVFTYLYYEGSSEKLERCYEHSDGTDFSARVCSAIDSAADSAYSSATASHLLTYFAIFTLVGLLALRLNKIEDRQKEIEGNNA